MIAQDEWPTVICKGRISFIRVICPFKDYGFLSYNIRVGEEVEQGLILMPGVVTNAATKQANQSLTKVVSWLV